MWLSLSKVSVVQHHVLGTLFVARFRTTFTQCSDVVYNVSKLGEVQSISRDTDF